MKKFVIPILILCVVAAFWLRFSKPDATAVSGAYVVRRDIETCVLTSGVVVGENDMSTDNLKIIVSVPESDISEISEGNTATIMCTAVQDTVYEGTVGKIYPYARQAVADKYSTTVVDVEIELVGSTDGIKPGYTADVTINGNDIEDAVTIPYDAVVTYGDDDYVWITENNKLQLRKVELGRELDTETQIKSGLDGGELVVINPPWNREAAETVIIGEVTE